MPERGTSDAKSLRLFVAIELPLDVRHALAAMIARLKAAGVGDGLRWVRPEGIHITLKFLGAADEEDLPAIVSSLRAVAKRLSPFEIQPAWLGSIHGRKRDPYEFRFTREPHRHDLRVLYVSLDGAVDSLKAAAASIEAAMVAVGFPAEKAYYLPHLTIARMKERADRESRLAVFEALKPFLRESSGKRASEFSPATQRVHVREISLMESTLQRGGAVYRALATFPLEGGG